MIVRGGHNEQGQRARELRTGDHSCAGRRPARAAINSRLGRQWSARRATHRTRQPHRASPWPPPTDDGAPHPTSTHLSPRRQDARAASEPPHATTPRDDKVRKSITTAAASADRCPGLAHRRRRQRPSLAQTSRAARSGLQLRLQHHLGFQN